MSTDMLLQILGYFVGGAAVYAAIKADLARAIALAEQAVDASSKAHRRIDDILIKG